MIAPELPKGMADVTCPIPGFVTRTMQGVQEMDLCHPAAAGFDLPDRRLPVAALEGLSSTLHGCSVLAAQRCLAGRHSQPYCTTMLLVLFWQFSDVWRAGMASLIEAPILFCFGSSTMSGW